MVAEIGATGDARAVARRHCVNERTLKWWRGELHRRRREDKRPAQRLLPVVVRAATQASVARADELEVFVEVGATRMTLRGAVRVEHLAAIVTASARAC